VLCFENAHSTGVTGGFWINAHSTGLSGEVRGLGWAGLKVVFNTEDAERTESGKRELGGFGDDHGA
jgi:hypothetical protein